MTDPGERHASWLELFFDLVAVVAVAQLAHRLQHPTWLDVALFALLYYAVWSVWTSMSLYANVRGDKTRVRSMLLCMFGIAVMAAAAPDVGHALGSGTGDNTQDPWFIAAYVFCRAVAARSLQGSGNILISWPSVHIGVGVIPWVASLWIDPPAPGDPVAWRYVLWGLGVVLDLTFTIHASLSPDRVVKQAQEQAERLRKREESRRGHGLRVQEITMPTAAILHPGHLGERLGLFVIIVLGEAVMQVVVAASGKSWDKELGLAALGGFGLIVALWWLTLQYGLSAVPDASEKGLRPAVALPAHYVMTAGITATAAGLGVVAEDPSAHLHGGIVWVLCGGLAVYFLASAVLGVANRAERRWLWGWALPSVVAPPVVAAIAGLVQAWLVVALLALVALWRVIYRASAPAPAEA